MAVVSQSAAVVGALPLDQGLAHSHLPAALARDLNLPVDTARFVTPAAQHLGEDAKASHEFGVRLRVLAVGHLPVLLRQHQFRMSCIWVQRRNGPICERKRMYERVKTQHKVADVVIQSDS